MSDAFYLADGDRFVATEWTRGPWSADAQHAGPPAALLGRAFELLEPVGELQVVRFTLEIFRPVPVRSLRVRARVARPGKRVQFVEGQIVDDDDEEVVRATAWRIRPSEGLLPPVEAEPLGVPLPEDSAPLPVFDPGWGDSYFGAIEWRFAGGAFFDPGPAAAWMRMRVPLVEGEDVSPLSRALVVADSGNGISGVLPLLEYLFINTDLTVHLLRMPVGEWVCLDATTRVEPHGIGLAESLLWDEEGRLGSGSQTLLVAPRVVPSREAGPGTMPDPPAGG